MKLTIELDNGYWVQYYLQTPRWYVRRYGDQAWQYVVEFTPEQVIKAGAAAALMIGARTPNPKGLLAAAALPELPSRVHRVAAKMWDDTDPAVVDQILGTYLKARIRVTFEIGEDYYWTREEVMEMTVAELRALAEENGLRLPARMSKAVMAQTVLDELFSEDAVAFTFEENGV